ncbi:hypothetical protein ACIPR8_00620 [Stenotrophomonas sp. LARHCG68]
MSLLNILIRPDRALILVDSCARSMMDGESFETSKLLLLPLENVVLCSRGELIFARSIYAQILNIASRVNYDSIADSLKGIAEDLFPRYLKHYRAAGLPTQHLLQQEICVVGWSARAGAPQGLRMVRDGDGFRIESMGGHIAPALPEGLPDQGGSTDEQWLCGIARRQIAHVKATASDTPIGGTLLLAKLTKDRTEMQRL